MVFDFKKVAYGVAVLFLVLVSHSADSQPISRTISYKAVFQPFGAGIHKTYPFPAEVDPEQHFQVEFNFDLTPEDINAEVTGILTFDQDAETLQIRGKEGKLQSQGGISFGVVVKIAFELPRIPFATHEPIPIKVEIPLYISKALNEQGLGEIEVKEVPIQINALGLWNESKPFGSFHFNGDPIEVRGGIRDFIRMEIQAKDIVELIITAMVASAGVPLPPHAAGVLGDAFEIALGNAAISYNLGFLSTATLTGKSIIVNGQQVTRENQIIKAPGLDLSQNGYTVHSTYDEQFTYQLDYIASSDVWLEFNPLGIPVWSYPKTVIAEFPTPIIPNREVDLDFWWVQTTFPLVKERGVRPPVAVNTILPQTLTEGGASRTIDVAGYFSSPNDLIYEVSPTPLGILTTRILDSRVTISPRQAGRANVVVTARDKTNRDLYALQTITVYVQSDRVSIIRPSSDPTFTPPTTINPAVEGLREGVSVIIYNTPLGEIGLAIRQNPWVDPQEDPPRLWNGATGTVTAGPETRKPHTWWKIEWDQIDAEAWSVEADIKDQRLFLRPPDLEIRDFAVSADAVRPGETFTVEATVQNNGPGESTDTDIYFYYQKSDEDTPRVAGSGKRRVSSLREGRSKKVWLRVEAPMTPGDYEYGVILPPDIPDTYDAALVDLLDPNGEMPLNNIAGEHVEVRSSPDLIVELVSPNKLTVDPGEKFRLDAVVRNLGIGAPTRDATLYYYLSSDVNISESDTEVGENNVDKRNLDTNGTIRERIYLNAPIEPGVYYCGARVDLRHERNKSNNYSSVTVITVRKTDPSDLVVNTPTLSANTLAPGQSATLAATVRNQGPGPAPATTLRGYRSANANISDVDTEVGSTNIGFLRPGGTKTAQIRVVMPPAAGTYYYGFCVEDVTNESDTGNNCSAGVALTVENLAPTAAETLPAQTLLVGDVSVVDMTPYFSDPNRDTLTYKGMSSSPEIVVVEESSLLDSHLRMNPLSVGTATVTVEATDTSGLTLAQQFSVTVNPHSNRAPIALSVTSVQQQITDGVSKVVDMSDFFHDLDGDTLHYTASSDDTGVVSVERSGSQVTFIPEGDGRATVTATANDGEFTATQTFTVFVGDTVVLNQNTPDLSAEVLIQDANLREQVRATLGLPEGHTLTQEKMEGLIRLDVSNAGEIKDLIGLEYATQLTELRLSSSVINDITPLKGLTKLTNLRIYVTPISDISDLRDMTALTFLDLGNNQITDVEPLENMTKLTHLDLENNQISDISALENMTKLMFLNLYGNQISDISALENMTKLTTLILYNNYRIVDITSLANLTKLATLQLMNNRIVDISPLSGLTDLTHLNIHGNRIVNISPLSGLTDLTILTLHQNQIRDITPLASLTSLTKVYLNNNQIDDVSALENLTSLTHLSLSGNPIVDLEPLRKLKQKNPKINIDIDINAALAPSAPVLPAETALLLNYPNPFNPETWIPYQLADAADVTLTIYNLQGVVVRQLVVGHQPAGFYHGRARAAHWDGRNQLGESVANGVYFYTLTAGDFSATRRMLIVK